MAETDLDAATELATKHLEEMSEPSEHAIEAERRDAEDRKSVLDIDGIAFDPSIHATDAAGNPVKTKRGAWRKRRVAKTGASRLRVTGPASQQYVPDTYHESAVATVDSIGTLATMIGGEAFAFQQYQNEQRVIVMDERENGIRAFERFYREKNMRDIPAGLAIAIWGLGYFGARFATSKDTRKSVRNAWRWIASKFTGKTSGDAVSHEEMV